MLVVSRSKQASRTMAKAKGKLIATVDPGSNSFHMAVTKTIHEKVRNLDKPGEKVQSLKTM